MNPHYNNMVTPLLTDMYQLTMTYAYFKQKTHQKPSTFNLFIRKAPFKGEFVVFAGLYDALSFIANFKFTKEHIDYIRRAVIPNASEDFYEYLLTMNTSEVTVEALPEGTIAFPKVPFITISGPLAVVQLLETTLLNICNFASLMATNAARHCMAVNYSKGMIEFGTRRAQGPDGALAAAKYSYIGGFNGTSNLQAGMTFDIPVMGTHAHSYVMSHVNGWKDITDKKLVFKGETLSEDFIKDVLEVQAEFKKLRNVDTNQNELVAFTAYALTFPDQFLALVDTYDVINSGAINFCIVSIALYKYGIHTVGVRLDSGDLAYQSVKVKELTLAAANYFNIPSLADIRIIASSDISEAVLLAIQQQPNKITGYGVGTHLVTCKNQPALGGVYKLVNIDGTATMKLSETVSKTTIPNRKNCFRLYDSKNVPVVDLMLQYNEPDPIAGQKILCRDPFNETKRTYVTPSKIVKLHKCYYKNGKLQEKLPDIHNIRSNVLRNISQIREDHLRPLNPTPYKVSVSQALYEETHQLWFDTRPIGNIQ
jgi:nicotinate phosphoribosyltransferase